MSRADEIRSTLATANDIRRWALREAARAVLKREPMEYDILSCYRDAVKQRTHRLDYPRLSGSRFAVARAIRAIRRLEKQ